MLTTVVGMVVLLGGLIFFHESGHYLVAKFFKVKVEVFSLGFGKKLFSWKKGETEYCLSIFPLGGYVKLMGDDPYKGVAPEEAHRAFSTQKLYKRFAIVAAGPIANLLLAYVLFTFVFWMGQPTVSPRLGNVAVSSPAFEAGLRSKDRVTAVSGTAVSTWNELDEALRPQEGRKVDLTVERGTGTLTIPVNVSRTRVKNPYGEDEFAGGIKGISPTPSAAVIGISDPKSAAYVAGLRTGDLITKIDAQPITGYEDISEALQTDWAANRPVTFTFQRVMTDAKAAEQSVTVALPKVANKSALTGVGESIGIFPSETFVKAVSADSPAQKGGLLIGDRVVSVNGQPIHYFEAIVDAVQTAGNEAKPITLGIERDGKPVSLDLKPVETTQEDPITHQTYKKFLIGFGPYIAVREPEMTKIQVREFPGTITRALNETHTLAKRMVISLWKLATGNISAKNLGGPILIATVAGKSLDAGAVPFLQMMALISINLFLLNLFPIPVLDGGHLLFFTIEALKGRPVSIRTMEIANQVGMVFILMLVVLTLFNDISRIVLN